MSSAKQTSSADPHNEEDNNLERLFLWVKNADAIALASDGILNPKFISESAKGKLILASVPKDIIPKIQRRELANVLDADLRPVVLY